MAVGMAYCEQVRVCSSASDHVCRLDGSLASEVSDDLEDVDDDVLGYAGLHWLAIDYLRKTDALLVLL